MEAPRLVPGTVAQHSVFLVPYGKGKLRQVGALQNAQHQIWRVELIVPQFFVNVALTYSSKRDEILGEFHYSIEWIYETPPDDAADATGKSRYQ